MSTSINANLTTNLSSGQTSSNLSASTKKKLKEAGIDPNSVSSEAEAQQKLQEAEKKQAEQNAQVQGNQESQSGNSNESLESSVKSLAAQVGASYTSDDSVEDILASISSKIEELMNSVEPNSTQAKIYEQYQAEYQSLYSSYVQAQTGAALLSSSLNGLANYNKATM